MLQRLWNVVGWLVGWSVLYRYILSSNDHPVGRLSLSTNIDVPRHVLQSVGRV